MKVVLFNGDSYLVDLELSRTVHRGGDDVEKSLKWTLKNELKYYDFSDVQYSILELPDETTDFIVRGDYYDDACYKEEFVFYVTDGLIHIGTVSDGGWKPMNSLLEKEE